jgi:5-methylthioadenosine/S-adenosylhomocysteine deaminase
MENQCTTLLHSAFIVTQDAQRRIIEDGGIAVKQGRIAAIGSWQDLRHWQAQEVLELGNMLVMPGLINAHTHATMTFLRGFADDLPLMEWLTGHIFPVEARLQPEVVRVASLLGFAEMLRTGTTACVDMYLFESAVLQAAAQAGIRCQGGEVLFTFPSAACPHWQQGLEQTRALAEEYKDNERISVAVTPHSVYTTNDALLIAARDMAAELNLPLHIHLAETAEETAQSLSQHGLRPIAYAESLGLLSPRTIAAHLVDSTEEEHSLLAQRGVTAVHNPSSNMKLASGIAPLPQMLAHAVPLALGSDGPTSNNRMNMFTEMHHAALLHKGQSGNAAALPAQSVLDMATHGGARALQQHPLLGMLAVDAPADLIALDLNEPNMQPLYSPVSHLVYAATGMEVRLSMVAGEVLYRDGLFSRFDYPALLQEVAAVRHWVLKKQA